MDDFKELKALECKHSHGQVILDGPFIRFKLVNSPTFRSYKIPIDLTNKLQNFEFIAEFNTTCSHH